jgi:hypothetical protein
MDDLNSDEAISELQTFGEIETLLKSGLSIYQVFNFMCFRARLIEMIYYAVNTSGESAEYTVGTLLDVVSEIEDDEQIKPTSEFPSEKSLESNDISKSCYIVVDMLKNSGPPADILTVNRDSYLALYSQARSTLPAPLLVAEFITQISDMLHGAGVWRHAN